MASSEGVTYRWEAFNRWCDEYADRHQGMKPKVEDVRRWHRENAEKVWPDSNERPSVFLAVSHNKGRRVRGHKTCEYYKRYRAGKAAEQQRLQPAALSGRRILAVTAAARKHNSDPVRGGPKRPAADDGTDVEPDLEQPEKRRRLHPSSRSRHTSTGHSSRSRLRRSSSEDFSDDASWASGAESSEDDSGSAALAHHGVSARLAGDAFGAHLQGHTGVHITVVRRDADGRPIQIQPQPLHPQADLLPVYGLQQGLHPSTALTALGRQQYRVRGSNGGASRGRLGSGYAYDSEDGGGTDAEDPDQRPPRRGHRGAAYGCQGEATAMEAEADDDAGEEDFEAKLQIRRRRGYSGFREVNAAWDCDPKWHPGIAPPECRGPRSVLSGEHRRPAGRAIVGPFSSGAGSRSPVAAAPRRLRDGRWLPGVGAAGSAGAPLAALKDPLDLLAQAACEALASPRPTQQGEAEGAEPAEAQPATVVKEEDAQAGECRPGASQGSAHSGRGDSNGEREHESRAEPSCQGHNGVQPKAEEERVAVKEEQLAPGEELARNPDAHANGKAASSECRSASTGNSGGCGAATIKPHGTSTAGEQQQQGTSIDAPAEHVTQAPPSPNSSRLLATDAVEWGAKGDGDVEADDGTGKPHDLQPPAAAATTSSVATAPSVVSAMLPAPTAGVPLEAGGHSTSAGTNSDGSGGAPGRSLSLDVEKEMANLAAANAAAANMASAAMAAAFLQQSRLGLNAAAGGLIVPLVPASAPPPLALPPMAAAAAVGMHAPLHAPPAMLWPALSGGIGTLAAPPPALAAAAPPLYTDPLAHVASQYLPMTRLLQMHMAARQDTLAGAIGSDAGGLSSSHPACLPPTV